MNALPWIVASLALLLSPQPDATLDGGKDVPLPKRIAGADPALPGIARDAGVQGYQVFEITLTGEGKPTDIRVLRGIPLLDQVAVEAIRKWRYEPTLVDGVARRVRFRQVVDMFLRVPEALKAHEAVASNAKAAAEWRVLSIGQIAKYVDRDRQRVTSQLLDLARDVDPAVAEAARSAIDAVPPPPVKK